MENVTEQVNINVIYHNVDNYGYDIEKSVLFHTVAIVFSCLLLVIMMVLNIPALIAYIQLHRYKLRKRPMSALSLIMSDLLAACVYLPVLIAVLHGGEGSKCSRLCSALLSLEKAQVTTSVWGTTIVIYSRYILIVRNQQPNTKLYVALLFVWILSVTIGTVSLFLIESSHLQSGECVCHLTTSDHGIYNLIFVAVFIVFCFILPTTMTFTLCSLIFQNSRRQLKAFCIDQTHISSNRESSESLTHIITPQDQYKVPATLYKLMLVMYVFLISPYFVTICCQPWANGRSTLIPTSCTSSLSFSSTSTVSVTCWFILIPTKNFGRLYL